MVIGILILSSRVLIELFADGTRGWVRTRLIANDYQQLILRRATAADSSDTSQEGVFTCYITGDINPVRSVHILYPSELMDMKSMSWGRPINPEIGNSYLLSDARLQLRI